MAFCRERVLILKSLKAIVLIALKITCITIAIMLTLLSAEYQPQGRHKKYFSKPR